MSGDRTNPTVYKANRWAMAVLSAVFLFGGIAMIWSVAWDPDGTGRAARIMASPVWDILAPLVGILLLVLGVSAARHIFDPRLLVVDDDGIESLMSYPRRRAEWRDFQDLQGLRLVFVARDGGKRRLIGLPTPMFGLDFRGMLDDIQSRIKRVRAGANSPKPVDKL